MTKRPKIAIPVPTTGDLEYNRRSWPVYASAVERSGGEAVEIPLDAGAPERARLIADCSGVLLPGSGADVEPAKYGQERVPECAPADVAREDTDVELLEEAQAAGKPVLAICFGTQMLNVWRGGTLVQDLLPMPVNHRAGRAVSVAHVAAVAPESMVGRMLTKEEAPERDGFLQLPVNSSHHQAIGVPGEGLRVAARSVEDGVIEGIEGSPDAFGEQFVVGVQWHPERTFEESAASRALFGRFVAEAAAWVPQGATVAKD